MTAMIQCNPVTEARDAVRFFCEGQARDLERTADEIDRGPHAGSPVAVSMRDGAAARRTEHEQRTRRERLAMMARMVILGDGG
jgi:hypothetical protein